MGRLTKDVEVRYSQSATPVAVARYTLAVPRAYKRDGEPDADFVLCKAFGKTAEFAAKYLKKGNQVGVTGRIQVSSYEDQQKVKRTLVEIIIDNHTFCSGNKNSEAGATHEAQGAAGSSCGFVPMEDDDDDLPF